MSCSVCIDLDDNSTVTFCGECGARVRDPMLDTVLDDRYRIDAKIAAGGFGSVYRATFIATGQEVAIKVMHAQHLADPSVSARFRREAVATSSLADPHTVTTHELGEDRDGTRFIVMELLRGESLQDRFTICGPLHWRKVLSVVRDVCSSLVEAHKLGIVHRDLKPANIFLATEPTLDFVKVLDFGIAKVVRGSNMHDGSELTRVGQAIGTLEYMAPEQLIGGAADQRTDIYTLGVVAYEMITGQRPFHDATGATALVTAVMTRRPPPPSTVTRGPLPRELDGTLLRCLEREPIDRYQSVQDLADVIDRMLGTQSEVVTTQQLWRPTAASDVAPVFADGGEDELTWIDTRPPEMDVTEAFLHVAHDAQPTISPPRGWRAVGTGAPGLEETDPAVPQPRFAVGSSPMIADSQPVTNPPVLPTAPARPSILPMIAIAILLASLGVAAGVILASLT